MNNENQEKNYQQPNGSAPSDSSCESEQREKVAEGVKAEPKKKRFSKLEGGAVIAACLIIFTFLYAVVNISSLSAFFSAILSVLAPIIIGGALAYILNPILRLFELKIFKKIKNKRVLRSLSMVMTYVVFFLLVTALMLLLLPQLIDSIMRFTASFDSYIDNIVNLINKLAGDLMKNDHYRDLIDADKLVTILTQALFKSEDIFSGIMSYISEYGMGLIVSLKNIILGLFISIYVLSSKERLKAQSAKLVSAIFSPSKSRRLFKYVSLCDRTFGGFFVGKIIDSLIIGVISLIVFSIFRLPYTLLVSTIVCITNIIPVFGPFIGAIPSFFIIFIVNPKQAFIFLILIVLIQQLDGNVIGPKILGNTTGISSLGVIISIIVMGEYFGVIGMLVGVPIFAVVITIIKEFLETRLRAKNKPTDTAEYYAMDSIADPHERHETISAKLFNQAGKLVKKIFRKKKKESEPSNEDSEDRS